MKKYLLLIVLISISSKIEAQNWNYNTSGNDFDGKYKSASITGNGNNYPYSKPSLIINHFEKNDSYNFYINGAGYYSDSSDVKVLWVFNNEKDVIYESRYKTLSADGKSIFFYEFYSPKSDETISVYEFINKLKIASTVSVRVSGKFDKNDIKFSLSGSTKAINHVISVEEIDSKINTIKIAREVSNEKERKKDSLINLFKTIKSKLNKISSNPTISVKGISKENFVGQKIKFLSKKNKKDYSGLGYNEMAYPYLKYDDFNGRIATIIDLKKKVSGYDGFEYIYKLELDDNKEIVYYKLYDYDNLKNDIGFISLLELAREKYLGKTFYSSTYPRMGLSDDIQECLISKITFAEDENEKYPQLYGAFNVYYKTNGVYNDYEGFTAKEELKILNTNFTNSYLPEKELVKSKYNEYKVFENIFYYIEE